MMSPYFDYDVPTILLRCIHKHVRSIAYSVEGENYIFCICSHACKIKGIDYSKIRKFHYFYILKMMQTMLTEENFTGVG